LKLQTHEIELWDLVSDDNLKVYDSGTYYIGTISFPISIAYKIETMHYL